MSESPRFEVHCPQCQVSFPVGTRRCLHCGGGTVEPEVAAQIHALKTGEFLPPEDVDETVLAEELEQGSGRRGPRSLTLLWILMAVAASIYRSCTTPG